jgi:spermidine/putrescine transport system permease protein
VWYAKLWSNQAVHSAAWYSLLLAATSTAIATAVGTGLALGLHRAPWPRAVRSVLDVTIHLPVVTPDIILAAAMVVAFAVMQGIAGLIGVEASLGLWLMILGHVTFQVAFVALVVSARLQLIERDQDEAARDLYAGAWYSFSRVLLPQLAPGIAAGAMLAFVLSLDDFVVSLFTASTSSITLPLYIYAAVKKGVSPEIHALSTVIIAITAVLVLAMARATPKTQESP